MDPQRQIELEAQLSAGTIADADLVELLVEAYGQTPEAAKAAAQPYGRYVDEEGESVYV